MMRLNCRLNVIPNNTNKYRYTASKFSDLQSGDFIERVTVESKITDDDDDNRIVIIIIMTMASTTTRIMRRRRRRRRRG